MFLIVVPAELYIEEADLLEGGEKSSETSPSSV